LPRYRLTSERIILDLTWANATGQPCRARWRSESGAAAPERVVLADDRMSADVA
jgi:hypothetical protein